MGLTAKGIQEAKAKKSGDRWLGLDAHARRREGRLLVRISPSGSKRFYYRYSLPDDRKGIVALGPFSLRPRPGALTLEQALEKVRELVQLHREADSRDVRAHMERKAREEREAREAEVRRQEAERLAAAIAADEMQRYTLRALVAAYVEHLRRRGKARSAQDAANIFRNHLNGSLLADRPAREITSDDFTSLVRQVVEAGKGRTAGKFRSYLRAAYALAVKSRLDPEAPSAFIAFRLTDNPVAPVGALATFNRARDHTLTDGELAEYWSRVAAIKSDAIRGALQLALLLGGQRPAQLLRLRRENVDLAGGWITLHDPKGARTDARTHALPITPAARAILAPLVERAEALESAWVFTSEGKVAVYPDTLATEVRRIALAMKRDRKARGAFMLSDLRRTAETMMSQMGISRDVRAQILSHGLGGVQQRHYDKHDYRAEKIAALTAWANRIESGPMPTTVVVPIKRRAS